MALPQLAGYLRKHDIPVATHDLNLDFFRYLRKSDVATSLLRKYSGSYHILNQRVEIKATELEQIVDLAQIDPIIERLKAGDASDNDFWLILRILNSELYQLHPTDEDRAPCEPTLFDLYYETLNFTERLEGARLVGISVAFYLQLYPALALARKIRAHAPEITIVFGGSFLNLQPEEELRRLASFGCIDAVIRQEGEMPLLTLANQIRQEHGLDFSKISGAIYQHAGKVQSTERAPAPDIDQLGLPSFNADELGKYMGPVVLPIMVSKGCYWGKCKFCDYVNLQSGNGNQTKKLLRFRNTKQLVREIEMLQHEYRAIDFHLISDAIPIPIYRAIAHEIIRKGLSIRVSSFNRVERKQDLAFFKLLRRAGVTHLVLGVEATVDRVLALMDKGNQRKDIDKTLRLLKAAGITSTVNIIPDYPTMTLAEVEETLGYLYESMEYIMLINSSPFILNRNSGVYNEPEKHGLTIIEPEEHSEYGQHEVRFRRTSGLTPEEERLTQYLFRDLQADIHFNKRVLPLLSIVNHSLFDWWSASFRLASDIQAAWLWFDPTEQQNGSIRKGKAPQYILTCHASRRHLASPAIMETIVNYGQDGRRFYMMDIMKKLRSERDIKNEKNTWILLQRSLQGLVENGMILEIYHPFLSASSVYQ